MKRWTTAIGAVLVLTLALFVLRARQDQPAPLVSSVPTQDHEQAAPAKTSVVESTPQAAPAPARMEVAPQPTAAPPSPPLESAEILVRGSVRDEHGQAVASDSLDWIDDKGSQHYASIDNGSYSMPGLLPGHYLVVAGINPQPENQMDVTLSPTPAVQQHDFTIRLRPEIAIRIVSEDGQPLIGTDPDGKILPGNTLLVCASRSAPGTHLAPYAQLTHGASDCGVFGTRWAFGKSRLDLAPDCLGLLALTEPPPLYISIAAGNSILETRLIEEVPKELVFRLRAENLTSKRAGVRLRLLDLDGKTPISKGSVDLEADQNFSRQTDADGRVEILDLPPGGYDLHFSAAGHRDRPKRRIELEAGQILDLGDVVFASRPRQSVRFQFRTDVQPPVQFVVKPEYAGDPLRTLGPLDNSLYSTLIQNPVEFALPEAGAYELRVVRVGDPAGDESTHLGARPLRVVFTDEPTGEIVIPIEATTEICLRPPQEASGISRWLVSTADGLPCQRVRIEGRAPTRIELVPGEYTIARIDPVTKAIGKLQPFTVASAFLALDLEP